MCNLHGRKPGETSKQHIERNERDQEHQILRQQQWKYYSGPDDDDEGPTPIGNFYYCSSIIEKFTQDGRNAQAAASSLKSNKLRRAHIDRDTEVFAKRQNLSPPLSIT